MNTEQQQAVLTIAMSAAFADGANDEREREHIHQLAETLGRETGSPGLLRIYQDVLLKRIDLTDAATALKETGHRQFAYEVAVCVCDADGAQTEAERRFLAQLKAILGLGAAQTETVEREAEALAKVPPIPEQRAPAAPGPVVAAVPSVPEPELDRTILNYAILNGALELLPQSWATVAIIPLQIKMVYRIGQAYGHQLDQGHIKEFLATAGVGLTSQYLEQFGRKLIGGLLGKAMGGLGKMAGSAGTGVAFSFATTYAVGQLAKRYYAGGRAMSTAMLRDTYQSLLGPARQLQDQYAPQIREKAGTLDAAQIMSLVRSA